MTLRLSPGPLAVATHNAGKIREILAMLQPYGVGVKSASELNLPEPEETGSTFAENAILKARAAAEASGLVALADDSGLAVDALAGDPGIYSARWAGPAKDFSVAMRKVEEKLNAAGATTPAKRRAHFVAVLAVASPGGEVETFEGRVDGTLVWPPRGTNGFGYDPMFQPEGYSETFGEMPPDAKHGRNNGGDALSHRARAFAAFARRFLEKRP
jgi:XTP/dITP diphosphohydrolase